MRDLRYALRRLLRAPAFAAIAIVTLGFGIAANTTMFAFVDALVFRPSRAIHLDDVMRLDFQSRRPAGPAPIQKRPAAAAPAPWASFANVERFRAFEQRPPDPVMAATNITSSGVTIRMPRRAARVGAEAVTGGYAAVFRLTPLAGRLLDQQDEDGALPNAVISERLWRDWFGGDRLMLGRTSIVLAEAPASGGPALALPPVPGTLDRTLTIVGVAPHGFVGALGAGTDLWLPMSLWRARDASARGEAVSSQPFNILFAFVRTRPNTTIDAVRSAVLNGLGDGVASAAEKGIDLRLPAAALSLGNGPDAAGLTILALAALLLVAACANLANMLYARGMQRTGEIAVRLALGSPRVAIFRMVAAESVVIAAAAVLFGLSVSWIVLHSTGIASAGALASEAYRARDVATAATGLDWRSALYALTAGALSMLVVGLVTAWRATRLSPHQAFAAGGVPSGLTARARRVRSGLVAVQVTAAVLLLMGTGLYVRRAADVFRTKVYYDTSHITAARIDVSLHGYTAARGRAFYDQLLKRVSALPGVQSAALTDGLPGYGYVTRGFFQLVPEKGTSGNRDLDRTIGGAYAGVSEGFLDTLGLAVIKGRPFRPTDRYGAPEVAIVCESAARRLWPGEDAIGKRVMFGNEGMWHTVVGISTDPVRATTDSAWNCESCVAFVPWDQRYRPDLLVMVRSTTPRAEVEPLLQAVHALDSDLAVLEAAPLDDSLLGWLLPTRAAALLIASLGGLALAIAGLGVYAVMSFLVHARVREFGIRLALGASPRQIVRSVLDDALHLLLVGLLPGVLVASLAERFLETRLRDLLPNDIPTWFLVPMIVLAVGMAAAYVPARRASKTDPNVALRQL